MTNYFDIFRVGLANAGRVLSWGIMIGAALLLPAIQDESVVYQYITVSFFCLSAILYNALNWRFVVRHFFVALIAIVIPMLLILPYSHISLSFLSSRIPIVIALMSIFIDEYYRLVSAHEIHWERAPSPRQTLQQMETEIHHGAVIFTRSRHEELLVHMNGGEGEQYHPPSQTSSDISLTTSAPGRLPSSCDTVVRAFWLESEQEYEIGRENDNPL